MQAVEGGMEGSKLPKVLFRLHPCKYSDHSLSSVHPQVQVCNTATNHPTMLTEKELDDVTAVFRSFETGLREATIHPKVEELYKIILSS